MAWRVKRVGETVTIKTPTTSPPAAGSYVGMDGAVVSAVDEMGFFVIDDVPDDNPPVTRTGYGVGTILENTAASFTPEAPIYSVGDGTISQADPAPGVGTDFVVVGQAISATEFIVKNGIVEDGGAS